MEISRREAGKGECKIPENGICLFAVCSCLFQSAYGTSLVGLQHMHRKVVLWSHVVEHTKTGNVSVVMMSTLRYEIISLDLPT